MPKFGEPGHPPSLGKATQFTRENKPRGGRHPSLRKQLSALLDKEGRIEIPAAQVVAVKRNGNVVLKVPTREQISMKLMGMAMSGNTSVTMAALKMVFEQLEGKAPQTVKIEQEKHTYTEEEIREEMARVDKIINGEED